MGNNKILIAIPSKKRSEVLRKNAFSWVPHTGIDFKVFIENDDIDEYSRVISSYQMIVLPDKGKGLGYSKTIIKKYAEENGYDFIVKIDDDVSGWTDFRERLLQHDASERFKAIIAETMNLFQKNKDCAVIAFPYAFQMFEPKQFKKTKRVQTTYICRTEYFHADPRISAFEDFAVGLNAMVKNKIVMLYGMAGIVMGVKVGGGEGGHQSYNREIQAMSEIDVLREIYPPLAFRKVDKIWKVEPDLRSVHIGYYK